MASSLRAHGWVPDQHGAWPMALLPILFGIAEAGLGAWHLVLLVAWLSAFAFFHAFELWAKTAPRRRHRIRAALVTWGILTFLSGVPLLLWRPSLWAWAPLFAPLLAVAGWGIWRRHSRALSVRVTTILASCLMTPVAYGSGYGTRETWLIAAFLCAYFLGTVPYVRSLIRGRRDIRWVYAAVIWHVVVTVAMTMAWSLGQVHWSAPAVWLLLSGRSLVVPLYQKRREVPLRPAVIGIIELVACALVSVAAAQIA
ncbi:YwiC-like family protein [Schaalia suimastitidis]|uniref:YwiC-like family protein n=1 Tax=Schaalia suimastitidis TaxID=121163 RepID=UPI000413BE49|nr:YwiC-like family protein [Schaalia suimastitidis]